MSTIERKVLQYLLNRATADRPQVLIPRTLLASNLNLTQVQVDCALMALERFRLIQPGFKGHRRTPKGLECFRVNFGNIPTEKQEQVITI